MKPYSVSAVITTYNRKAWVSRAVDSVLQQTSPADEIIVVDDGSDDGTEEMIQDRFPQIQYIWQNNQGISAARNAGIKESTGEWIGFLDADDTWKKQKLSSQIQALKNNPEYLVCHTDEIWIRKGKRVNPGKIHQKYGGDIFDKCLPLCLISPSSVLMHCRMFKEIGLFDTDLPVCEDYDMWLRVCAVYPVLYLEKPLIVKYGGHDDQLSKKHWGMDRFRIAALEKIINHPGLDSRKHSAAIQEILKKIQVFIAGAGKRGREESVRIYKKKYQHYQSMLNT